MLDVNLVGPIELVPFVAPGAVLHPGVPGTKATKSPTMVSANVIPDALPVRPNICLGLRLKD